MGAGATPNTTGLRWNPAIAAPFPKDSFMTTPFHRLRFVLRATVDFEIPGRQGALAYALLCQANRPAGEQPAYPRDLLLDVPEQSRTTVAKHSFFAFGGTLLSGRPDETGPWVAGLRKGLDRVGSQGKPRRQGLGGNFRVELVDDLIAGRPWQSGPLKTLSGEHLSAELQRLLECDQVTLRFLTPLRMERPGRRKESRHSSFDEQFFDVDYFINRLLRRMRTLGIELRDPLQRQSATEVTLADRQLVWLDMAYGGRHRKTLGGVVGQVTLCTPDPVVKAALVWGQYSRVGKNTAFGFGAYRIDELGAPPFPCSQRAPVARIRVESSRDR